jgi:hypothetical protein
MGKGNALLSRGAKDILARNGEWRRERGIEG